MSANPTPSSDGGSIWSKPITVWSTVFIAVVIVAAIVLAVTSTGGKGEQTNPSPDDSTTPIQGSSDSSCGLPAGDQSVPTIAGPDVNWGLVGKVAAPSEPKSIGPGVTSKNGVRSCYAHSPSGALFAAVNMYAQGSSPELARASFEQNVLKSAGRDVVLADWKDPDGLASSVQVAGFAFIEYTASRTVVDIVVTQDGNIVSFVTELQWSEGDWKFVLQDNGQPSVPPKPLPGLTGYVAWSGA